MTVVTISDVRDNQIASHGSRKNSNTKSFGLTNILTHKLTMNSKNVEFSHLSSSARCNNDHTLWPCGLSCISVGICSWSSSDTQSASNNINSLQIIYKYTLKYILHPVSQILKCLRSTVFDLRVTHSSAAVAVVSPKSEAEVRGAVHAHHHL